MMWICNDCFKDFEEPKLIKTTWELYYDLSDGATPLEYKACPYCGDENIQRCEDEWKSET